jgi:hypothetical protein
MRLLKWIAYALLCVGCVLVLMVLIGAFVPEQHTVSATVDLPASQQRVWQLLTDVDAQPKWRTGLKSIELRPDENGHSCWTEVQKHMRMPLCADVSSPESTRTVRIADRSLPFGGNWVYDLQSTGTDSSKLTITENGTVGPALWRFVDHFLIHEDANIKQFEADLLKATKQ